MPMEWVEPELFLEHKGVEVYHIYKDDDAGNGPRTYWYGTSMAASDCGSDNFDVRELPMWKALSGKLGDEMEAIRATIIAAIDSGDLKPWED